MISCLMVTQPNARRFAFAKASIADYCRQSYPDTELVIVLGSDPGGDDVSAWSAYICGLGRPDIHLHLASPGLRLGSLRNLGMAMATGDVFCQWDDDDLYHPERLERQFAVLERGNHAAVYLREVLQYFPDRQALYLTNWRATPAGGHPGTLMVRRAAMVGYPQQGTSAALGEDLAVALRLIEDGNVGYLGDAPYLHLYVSHGANSWGVSHHAMLARDLAVSKAMLLRREASLRAGLAPFVFEPDSIAVTGNNGIAFRIEQPGMTNTSSL